MYTDTQPRPWVPDRPTPPPPGYVAVDGNTLAVPGLAVVVAHPYRRIHTAEAFARRIAAQPAAYLDVLTAYGVEGITDLRPASHARGGSPFGRTPPPWSPPPRDAAVPRPGRPPTYPVALVHPDREADPAAGAARAETLAVLSAGLPAVTVAALAHAWAGGELPDDVAADLRRRFTRDRLADVLDGKAVAHG